MTGRGFLAPTLLALIELVKLVTIRVAAGSLSVCIMRLQHSLGESEIVTAFVWVAEITTEQGGYS